MISEAFERAGRGRSVGSVADIPGDAIGAGKHHDVTAGVEEVFDEPQECGGRLVAVMPRLLSR